eukprot:scaffold441_cov382-Prasinococcus_capsulatus_cf.AAC.8
MSSVPPPRASGSRPAAGTVSAIHTTPLEGDSAFEAANELTSNDKAKETDAGEPLHAAHWPPLCARGVLF